MNLKKHKGDLLFLPLGGSGEIGMNLNLYHLDGKWIVVDCGIGFTDEYYPGADIIVPDTTFIEKIKKDIIGMVITHAHEDHVGGIPYIWQDFECPVYTTKFTAAFLKTKLAETHFGKKVEINEIHPGEKFELGPFEINPINLTHSIPEMHAMSINTRYGRIMHTGDWKFDPEPQVGPASNKKLLKQKGDKGILALVCDSTNVFSEGTSGSEATVRKNLMKLIGDCKERVAVGTFASNLARVETIMHAASEAGRDVIVCGRSLWRLIECAQETGYLKHTPKLWSEQDYAKVPRKKALLLCTGSQAEPRAALSRMAEGTHPIKLTQGDKVIFSSKIIPGNERPIFRMLNLFTLQGMEIVTEKQEMIHVSGHPYRNELKEMYKLTQPKIAIPVHGEAMHIHEHAKLAKELGVKKTFEPENGHVIKLNGSPETLAFVKAGQLAVDGYMLLAGDSQIMRERRKQKYNGAVFASLVVDKNGHCKQLPKLSTPGLLDAEEDEDFLEELAEELFENVEGVDTAKLQTQTKKIIRKMVKRELDKNPVIEVHIIKQ